MIIVNNYNNIMINLRSKITIKLLDYYFLNKEKANYINELAKILEVDPGNLFRKLKELEKDGLFSSELRGNQRYFFINKKYPFLFEYIKMYESKFGFVGLLKEELKDVKGLSEAYIFGSLAKGNFREASDIDLLIVGSHNYESLLPIISGLEKKMKREINVVDFTNKEFLAKQKKGDEFIKNVFSDKIIKII